MSYSRLISHGFRAPLVRSNSYVWRAALPAFVEWQKAAVAEPWVVGEDEVAPPVGTPKP